MQSLFAHCILRKEEQMPNLERLLRRPEVQATVGVARSTLYGLIKKQLFPKPSASARVASHGALRRLPRALRGASDDEIRALVARLEATRKDAA